MGWGKVGQYLLELGKYLWQEKFMYFFMLTTVVISIMWNCERMESNTLTENLDAKKLELITCENIVTDIVNVNKNMTLSVEACQAELVSSKKSFENAKAVKAAIAKELERYKEMANGIDIESDAGKKFLLKKKFLEELFFGPAPDGESK